VHVVDWSGHQDIILQTINILCVKNLNSVSKYQKMKEEYFIDAAQFSLDKFRTILKTKDILPGRIILKDNVDENFDILKSKGIISLFDLLETLKTKPKLEKFSNETGLSVDYLTILRREANSYVSVPVKLADLPFTEMDITEKLNAEGIKDSKQLFDIAARKADRELVANRYKLPIEKLTELVRLCDLVRITGVGPVFARIIYDSGIRSAKEFLDMDSEDLFERLTKTNNDKGLTKAKFSVKDIEYCIELGKELPVVLE
jgi:hypothetical protein